MIKLTFDGHMKTRIANCGFLPPSSCLCSLPYAQGQGGAHDLPLIRHADKIDDAPDALLNDAGSPPRPMPRAKMLADVDIQQIYTSDLQRTQQTATPLAQQRQLKPVVIPLSKVDDLIEAIRSGKESCEGPGRVAWRPLFPRFCTHWALRTCPRLQNPSMTVSLSSLSPGNKEHAALSFTVLRYCDRTESLHW